MGTATGVDPGFCERGVVGLFDFQNHLATSLLSFSSE